MPSLGLYGSFAVVVTLPSLVVGAVVRAKTCPLSHCQNENNVDVVASAPTEHYTYSLLETSSKKSTVAAESSSKAGCNGQTFLPAHFTCTSCDVQTCKGCNNVVCDVQKCIGKFYTQECWCKKPLNPDVEKFFCDDDCSGGLCNTKGLTCETREKACKPWWWCKLPPPKEPADSFLQKMTSRSGACSKKETTRRYNERLTQARTASTLKAESRVGKKQIDDFDFSSGEWVCESALIPAPDENPLTLAKSPAGFIVMDKTTCTGGFFKSKCFCYDKFLYFRGEDAKVNELDCDDGCGQGPCGGKTCGKQPPPPLPAPTPAPLMDPLLQEIANQGMLRNYGTQMSPVT